MDSPLAKKILIRPGNQVLIRNAPPGFMERLEPMPEGAVLASQGSSPYDVILHFVHSKAEVDAQAPDSLRWLKDQGVLWMIYPKRSKTLQTDINRDSGWEALWDAGWVGISIAAIDETWAALRFRPSADVKRKPYSIFLR